MLKIPTFQTNYKQPYFLLLKSLTFIYLPERSMTKINSQGMSLVTVSSGTKLTIKMSDDKYAPEINQRINTHRKRL